MDSTGNIILIIGLALLLLSIAVMALWIWMLVHAITKNNTETQILWIVLMVVFGPLAAIVYYFAVKKPMDAKPYTGGNTSFK